MPSSQRQKGIIIKATNKKTGKRYYIVTAQKTGFMDVWIGDKRYYYNSKEKNPDLSKVDVNKIIEESEAKERRKRGVIVIKRK